MRYTSRQDAKTFEFLGVENLLLKMQALGVIHNPLKLGSGSCAHELQDLLCLLSILQRFLADAAIRPISLPLVPHSIVPT